ncbi:hypothetical protein DICVIV_03725 [Dictyocaulus viviparus]|uniref:Molybdopterin dehydrogenase FAD-binding domain-containing protein n=1 Tax=Dictyocaulus viviparus TaxID=29172 RepID=A0A0D8XZJ3_DICVI|nr:hypothetical protein DICVIV_03725 [Dictyocaulus viviparus]
MPPKNIIPDAYLSFSFLIHIIKSLHRASFACRHSEITWYQPTTYRTLLKLKQLHPAARFTTGNTELGVELKLHFVKLKIIINPRQCILLVDRRKTISADNVNKFPITPFRLQLELSEISCTM